jgi:tetratricopeptide (TPR) repeat protein
MGRFGLIYVLAAILMAGAAAPPPETPVAQVLAALDQGDPQAALRLSDSALQQETQDPHVRACLLLYRGLAGALLGTPDAALRDLTEAINSRALLPDELGQAHLQRGFLREGSGQSDEAVADYGAAIALKGYSTAIALNNRGNIYLRRGRSRAKHPVTSAAALSARPRLAGGPTAHRFGAPSGLG